MSGNASSSICILSAEPLPARLLPRGHQMWGILRSIKAVGGGLICIVLGTRETLVPEELSSELQSMIGQPVAVAHIDDEYRCGRLSA
jgi:hypothetical protein